MLAVNFALLQMEEMLVSLVYGTKVEAFIGLVINKYINKCQLVRLKTGH